MQTFSVRTAFACLLLCSAAALSAHPHLFMTSSAEFVWEKDRLAGFWLEWEFDQFFSTDTIYAHDADRNGSLNAAEIKEVYNNAFINLKNYYFFTFIRQGGNRWNPPGVRNFTAGIRPGGVLWYRFFIDLSTAAPGEINVAVYDYTFFCDIRSPDKNPVKLTFDPQYANPSWSVVENKDFPVYYNPLGGWDDTTIYYEWKKGLETYYPREIRISYAK